MKFNELFVGDTFNFVSDELGLGTCFISYYTDATYGDVKVIYSAAKQKAFPFVESEKPTLISTEIALPFDTEVELINRSIEETLLNGVAYNGRRILYSSHDENRFVAKDKDQYILYNINGSDIISTSYKTFDDALYAAL